MKPKTYHELFRKPDESYHVDRRLALCDFMISWRRNRAVVWPAARSSPFLSCFHLLVRRCATLLHCPSANVPALAIYTTRPSAIENPPQVFGCFFVGKLRVGCERCRLSEKNDRLP